MQLNLDISYNNKISGQMINGVYFKKYQIYFFNKYEYKLYNNENGNKFLMSDKFNTTIFISYNGKITTKHNLKCDYSIVKNEYLNLDNVIKDIILRNNLNYII